ncbi:hypothetical protein [Azospirillum argentinense]|uniref:Uncharacterized protein n=1 Tax=Azospirillum argentinense TaxID=2970906 RepID=A0A5B0KM85_9PROT|nr:hypothetical protein [Azospirillum argentinense]KAA1053787.1 hypothetical protein FH063_002369 [Azospirillum argentinense]
MSTPNAENVESPFEDDLAALLATFSGYGSFVHELVGDAGGRLWAGAERPGPEKLFAFEVHNAAGDRWLALLVWKEQADGGLTGALVRSADVPTQYEDEAVTLGQLAVRHRLSMTTRPQWDDVLDLADELIAPPDAKSP